MTAVGAGLSNGMIGFRYSQWLRDPAIIVNAALGLEGWVAGVRLPVQNLSDFDLVIDFSGLFTPGILGMLTDSDGGIIFSDHSALVGAGLGIQRWVKNSRDYSLYIYAGVSYWFQVSGYAEGNDDRLLGPELQLGVSY